jgi:glutathione S-transferase
MKRLLYDLAAADESIRFSPYCWRIKLALAHKNLSFETVPWHFTDKEAIAFSGQGKVPVLVDGENTLFDSQSIAEYLETAYPNEASLFGDPPSRALTMFIKAWTERILHTAVLPLLLPDIYAAIAEQDKAYFRASREAALGVSIEEMAARRAAYVPAFTAALAPLRATLKTQSFIAGTAPSYADHIVYGALRWATTTSKTPLLEDEAGITNWMHAVLETYGL